MNNLFIDSRLLVPDYYARLLIDVYITFFQAR